jgi:hypothetical protein
MAIPLIALILEGDFIRHAGSGEDVTGSFRNPASLNTLLVSLQNKNVPDALFSQSRQPAAAGY